MILGKVCVHHHLRLVSRSDSAVVVLEAPGHTGCVVFDRDKETVLMDRDTGPCRLIHGGEIVTMGHDDKTLVYLQRENS